MLATRAFKRNISLLLGNGASSACGVHWCRAHDFGGEGRDMFGGEGEEVADAQPTPGGGGDTEARQQKARREMQHSIYF
jgi:hypothetical protein